MIDHDAQVGTPRHYAGPGSPILPEIGAVHPAVSASEPALPSEPGGGGDQQASVSEKRWKRRILIAALIVVVFAAAVVLPPLINIGRYQKQVTALVSRALGRSVRLSSVELRLLPRPGFVLRDLAVSEDPAFGAEPALSARTVVASVNLLSLWRGRLEIDRVSADEASLNLVRSTEGRWNLETLVMGAQPGLGSAGAPGAINSAESSRRLVRFPYLEATNSRVNLKNGLEKTPYSIVGTELSLWQNQPGEWNIRLRGQPVRTDTELTMADTGEIRVEASLRPAPELHSMPLRLQMEWRAAQLGQLSRLLLGFDAGWRGDMTADIEMTGTAESAQTKARVRATGVRREEFTPQTALDFDTNCTLDYQRSRNAVHNLACDTGVAGGHLLLKAEVPGQTSLIPSASAAFTSVPATVAEAPTAQLDVQKIPLQATFDLLRTIRRGFAPGIQAEGTINGTLVYRVSALDQSQPIGRTARGTAAPPLPAMATPAAASLQGSLTIDDGVLKGGQLTSPLTLPKVTWMPLGAARNPSAKSAASTPSQSAAAPLGLAARLTIPLAPASPAKGNGDAPVAAQAINLRLSLGPTGYEAEVTGSASPDRLRELAYALGLPHTDAADGIVGGAVDLDLTAAGAWITENNSDARAANAGQAPFSGSMILRHAHWQAPYLGRPLDLPQATVAIAADRASIASEFGYGSLHGSLAGNMPITCVEGGCKPQIGLRFAKLDGVALQTALLSGPSVRGSLLSPLLARMRPASKADWPALVLQVQADSLALGSVELQKPQLRGVLEGGLLTIDSWDAALLGGSASGTGTIRFGGAAPEYAITGSATGVNPTLLGAMLQGRTPVVGPTAAHWSGGQLSGKGRVTLSGFNQKDLAASAQGDLDFRWIGGSITAGQVDSEQPAEPTAPGERSAAKPASRGTGAAQAADPPAHSDIAVPLALSHFNSWVGTVLIRDGKAQLGTNELTWAGGRSHVNGALPIGGPARLAIEVPSANAAPPQR